MAKRSSTKFQIGALTLSAPMAIGIVVATVGVILLGGVAYKKISGAKNVIILMKSQAVTIM